MSATLRPAATPGAVSTAQNDRQAALRKRSLRRALVLPGRQSPGWVAKPGRARGAARGGPHGRGRAYSQRCSTDGDGGASRKSGITGSISTAGQHRRARGAYRVNKQTPAQLGRRSAQRGQTSLGASRIAMCVRARLAQIQQRRGRALPVSGPLAHACGCAAGARLGARKGAEPGAAMGAKAAACSIAVSVAAAARATLIHDFILRGAPARAQHSTRFQQRLRPQHATCSGVVPVGRVHRWRPACAAPQYLPIPRTHYQRRPRAAPACAPARFDPDLRSGGAMEMQLAAAGALRFAKRTESTNCSRPLLPPDFEDRKRRKKSTLLRPSVLGGSGGGKRYTGESQSLYYFFKKPSRYQP